jgi:hypothetical protein
MTAKTLAFGVLLGNIIGMILYAAFINAQPAAPTVQTGSISILGVNITSITNLNPGYGQPQTGISLIDLIIAAYFTLSTAWALWAILNIFTS